ncbi:hypothetical protein [Modestobacter sp. SYSU DS0511]
MTSGAPGPDAGSGPDAPARDVPPAGSPFAALAERPVTEHVGVYEAEHERLQRELSTIDEL